MIGLSVVIPCYNSRGTILRCLKSIENSSIDVEVIVIEDCSEEDSENIVLEYASHSKLDVKYYKNDKNLGAGLTRNRGIEAASREYITFLDSDDEFADDYFLLLEPLLMIGYDAIIYDAVRVFSDSTSLCKMFFSNYIREGVIDAKDALVFVKGGTCGKVYKTSIIKDNNVEFASIPRNEDTVFSKTALSYVNNVYYLEKDLYKYNDNEGSLMNTKDLLDPNNAYTAYDLIASKLKDRGLSKELNNIYLIEVIYSTTCSYIKIGLSNKDVKEHYQSVICRYNRKDSYRRKLLLKYRITFLLFDLGLFNFYGRLRYRNNRSNG